MQSSALEIRRRRRRRCRVVWQLGGEKTGRGGPEEERLLLCSLEETFILLHVAFEPLLLHAEQLLFRDHEAIAGRTAPDPARGGPARTGRPALGDAPSRSGTGTGTGRHLRIVGRVDEVSHADHRALCRRPLAARARLHLRSAGR